VVNILVDSTRADNILAVNTPAASTRKGGNIRNRGHIHRASIRSKVNTRRDNILKANIHRVSIHRNILRAPSGCRVG
jgi:hypothetical protein